MKTFRISANVIFDVEARDTTGARQIAYDRLCMTKDLLGYDYFDFDTEEEK